MMNSEREIQASLQRVLNEYKLRIREMLEDIEASEILLEDKQTPTHFVKEHNDKLKEKRAALRYLEDEYDSLKEEFKEEFDKLISQGFQDSGE